MTRTDRVSERFPWEWTWGHCARDGWGRGTADSSAPLWKVTFMCLVRLYTVGEVCPGVSDTRGGGGGVSKLVFYAQSTSGGQPKDIVKE